MIPHVANVSMYHRDVLQVFLNDELQVESATLAGVAS